MGILITGTTGFVGSHFADLLPNAKWFVGDIRSNADVVRNLRNIDTVVHFAALTYVPPSWDSPDAFIRTNYEGTTNFLKNHEMFKYFVYISSSHVYGDQTRFPITLDNEPNPLDPYSISKLAAEKAVRAYGERFGFDTLIIRPFNNFGPRQSRHFVVPALCLQAIKDNKMVVRGDGQRDFIYVKDNVRAIKTLVEKRQTGLIQICLGITFKISQIADAIGLVTGTTDIKIEPSPRKRDIKILWGSTDSLYQALPDFKFTPMADAIEETVKYYRTVA